MDVLMPQLGETVAEGKVTSWFKQVGDAVKAGDNLFEIETDKVTMEIQAIEGGVLSEIRVPVGVVAPVGAVVATIGNAGTAAASQPAPAPAAGPARAPSPTAQKPIERLRSVPAPNDPIKLDPYFEVRTPAKNFGAARSAGGFSTTPLARRLAAEAGIDLAKLKGSGPRGRIVAKDIAAAPLTPARPRGLRPLRARRKSWRSTGTCRSRNCRSMACESR